MNARGCLACAVRAAACALLLQAEPARALAMQAGPAAAPRRETERAPAPAPQGPVVTEASQDGIVFTRRIEAAKGWQPGAPLAMRVTATGTGIDGIDIPALADRAGAFDVRGRAPVRGTAPGTAALDATLVAWDAGELELPAMRVVARRADGQPVEVQLPAVTVRIDSLVGETPITELASGLRGPVEIGNGRLWWWILAGTGAAASLALAWWMMHRPGPSVEAPPLPADEWALREIERLEADRLPERGDVDGFFVRLSDVVRTYIERRFGIAAPEQTTQEFIRAAGRHPDLAGGHERTLAQFLRTADMVKFAAQRPAGTECGRALDAMRGFVRATAPVHAPAQGTPPMPAGDPPVAPAARPGATDGGGRA